MEDYANLKLLATCFFQVNDLLEQHRRVCDGFLQQGPLR